VKHITLRQLRVFLAAARHMNFSRAAQELHLTQPAVSTQIKELAAGVGLPLFERIGRRTYLTPAGEELLQCARAITQRLRETDESLAQLKGVTGGRLNVAVISAGDYFFPRLLAAFGARHPGITFNLTVHNREGLLRQLAENLADLAVMVRPPRDMDTVATSFAPHPYVIVARPDHPLAAVRQIPRTALNRERFVQREHGSDTWNSMREVFGRQFPRLNIAMQIQSPRPSSRQWSRASGSPSYPLIRWRSTCAPATSWCSTCRDFRRCCTGIWCTTAPSGCRRSPLPSRSSCCATAPRSSSSW